MEIMQASWNMSENEQEKTIYDPKTVFLLFCYFMFLIHSAFCVRACVCVWGWEGNWFLFFSSWFFISCFVLFRTYSTYVLQWWKLYCNLWIRCPPKCKKANKQQIVPLHPACCYASQNVVSTESTTKTHTVHQCVMNVGTVVRCYMQRSDYRSWSPIEHLAWAKQRKYARTRSLYVVFAIG